MRGLALLVVVAAIAGWLAPRARAADVTEVPAGISREAVKAFKRGLELHKTKQWTAAIKEYGRAVALGGRFPETFNNLAYCYRKIGQVDRAIELYKVALQLRPTFPQAHDYLAHCLKNAIDRNDPDYNDMPWASSSASP